MLFFSQPWIGVAERAPLTSTELAEGDEFFETIEEMESCALLQEAARDDSYRCHGIDAHMGQRRRHLAGEYDHLQTTVVAGLCLQTSGAALQRGSSTCSSWRSSTSSRSRSSATCTSS